MRPRARRSEPDDHWPTFFETFRRPPSVRALDEPGIFIGCCPSPYHFDRPPLPHEKHSGHRSLVGQCRSDGTTRIICADPDCDLDAGNFMMYMEALEDVLPSQKKCRRP